VPRDLARLRAEQGRRGEASDLPASVNGWFTEGFDTADLKEAKTLLDELTEPRLSDRRPPGASSTMVIAGRCIAYASR
jgi:predicted ATPase